MQLLLRRASYELTLAFGNLIRAYTGHLTITLAEQQEV